VTAVPPLPEGDAVPSKEELADRLASALPEGEREEARALLKERILPSALGGLADHPRPRRLTEVFYEDLAERLGAAAPEDRLDALSEAADVAEIRGLSSRALMLAVARYLSDDPNAVPRAGQWLDGEADRWRQRPAREIAAEASKVLDMLEAWQERVSEGRPNFYETRRMDYMNARLALQSARSGSFRTTSGALHDFLRDVGTPGERLDIH
jgi:hypothetical protein